MADKAEIEKAMGAHGLWKNRLKQVLNTGVTDIPVATIQLDNQCAFGKWLYGSALTPADTASVHYKTVKELHAQFHKAASHVAACGVRGDRVGVEKMMAFGGLYSEVSSKLTQAMMAWKNAI